ERERHDAYEALRSTFGDATDNVISMLQPVHELVTKDDLALTAADLRAEMADLRTEMADLRSEFRTVLRTGAGAQARTMVLSLVGSVILLASASMLTVALT